MNKIKEIYQSYFKEYTTRTFVFSTFSLCASIAIFIFNLSVGLFKHAIWNTTISFYYFVLLLFRIIIFIVEHNIKNKSEIKKEKSRRILYFICSILLLIMSISLIGPIYLMTKKDKSVYVNDIIAITFAAYTFYRLGISIYNIVKTKDNQYNLSIRMLKVVNLIGVFVSLSNLQTVLIQTFDNGTSNMELFSTITNAFIWLFLIIISIMSIKKGFNYNKEYKKINKLKD